jgi:hypothetical protein
MIGVNLDDLHTVGRRVLPDDFQLVLGRVCWCSVDMRTYWAARELERAVGGVSVVFILVTNLDVGLRVTTAHKQRALS